METILPVSGCLIPTAEVPESYYVSNPCSPLPTGNSDPNGRLVYTHSMDNVRGAGSPKCPAAVFDSRGLAPTGLATVFENEEEFGVNTGLVFRTNTDGSTLPLPSRLTPQEVVNIGNFPHDTEQVAKAIGLTSNQVCAGVNNAVPPAVCYPIACWFRDQLDSVLEARTIPQANKGLIHCGSHHVQQWLSPKYDRTKRGGDHNHTSMDAPVDANDIAANDQFIDDSDLKEKMARCLHNSLAAASLLASAELIGQQHKLI